MKKWSVILLALILLFSCAGAEELASAEVPVGGVPRMLTLTQMTVENGNLNLYFTGYGVAFSADDWMPVILVDGERLENWAAFPGEELATFIYDTDRIPEEILLISPDGEKLSLWIR